MEGLRRPFDLSNNEPTLGPSRITISPKVRVVKTFNMILSPRNDLSDGEILKFALLNYDIKDDHIINLIRN